MNSRQIDCFIEVATHLSFSRAAENLFLTQSVISYQISSLERELGFPLLQRDTHSVRLTPAGDSLYRDFLSIKEKTDSSIRKAQLIYQQTQNKLNIGWVVKMNIRFIGALLSACRDALPGIQINLIPNRESDIVPKIQNGDFDIAFLFIDDVLDHPEISFIPLFETRDYCWVNTSHPLATRSHMEIDDLENEVIVFQKAASSVKDALRVYNDLRKTYPDASILYVEDYEETAIPMILANSCVALAPFADHSHDNGIVCIPFGHYDPMHIGIAWRTDNHSGNVFTCIELIKKIYDKSKKII